MNAAQLAKAAGCSLAAAEKWLQPILSAMQRFNISTPARMAAFIAQISHESARLIAIEENLNYSAQGLLSTFGKRFTTASAKQYARKPEAIANHSYAGRNGNGDESSGDGWKYRGRGLIQITGKDNYRACGSALGIDLVGNPDLLLDPANGAAAAGWFWMTHGCNELADHDNFASITKVINGGLNGQKERLALFAQAESVLEATALNNQSEKP